MRVAGAFTWTNAGGGSTAVYYSRQLLRCLRGITKARLRQHVSRGEDDVVDGNAARARRGRATSATGEKSPGGGNRGGWEIGPRASAARARAITRAARCRDTHRGGASSHARSPAASRSGRGRPEASPATPSIGPGPRAPETGRGGRITGDRSTEMNVRRRRGASGGNTHKMSLTKKPTNPMTMNPRPVRSATLPNSLRSGLVHLFSRRIGSLAKSRTGLMAMSATSMARTNSDAFTAFGGD